MSNMESQGRSTVEGRQPLSAKQKRFFSSHSKSSAAVVSIALHLILLLIAGTFVAVQVVVKKEKTFESRQVSRPKMPPKKLQVPVKIKKQRPKPKLRQRIVVNKVRNMPDIKMPEISGIKGGLGAVGGAGLGDASSIGFNMPEINLFGVRSKGEKVFLALDTGAYIMRDEVGGKLAYAIIKQELVKVVEELGPTTLFNLAVFDQNQAIALFQNMVPASRENVAKVGKWLDPLNKVTKENVGTTGMYGLKTLGKGGTQITLTESMKGGLEGTGTHYWFRSVSKAMVEQADTVFILAGQWGSLGCADGPMPEWAEQKRKKWYEYLQQAKEEHKKENARRAAKGEPEQIISDDLRLMETYFPEKHAQYRRLQQPWKYFTWKDYVEVIKRVRKGHAPNLPAKSGLTKKRDKFTLNVVFFAPKNHADTNERFKMLAKKCNGDFRILKGFGAIESSVSAQVD